MKGAALTQLRAKSSDLDRYACTEAAKTCEANATDLESAFTAIWLAELSVADAARESGYSEERLREMPRRSKPALI
jgi:hypothetical protein